MSKVSQRSAATKPGVPSPNAAEVLSGDLSIRDSEALRSRLMQRIAKGGPLSIDLGGLTGVDTSIVQLLLAAKRSAGAKDRALEFSGFAQSPLPGFLDSIGLAPDELFGGAPGSGRRDAEGGAGAVAG